MKTAEEVRNALLSIEEVKNSRFRYYENYLDEYARWITDISEPDSTEVIEEHHILPSKLFPQFSDLMYNSWNSRRLIPRDHLWAHYLLYKAFPFVRSFYMTLYMMTRDRIKKGLIQLNDEEARIIAESYQEAKVKARIAIREFKSTPEEKKRQSEVQRRVNLKENTIPHDYTCSKCLKEFKQITKGVFGGHRKACMGYDESLSLNHYHRLLSEQEWSLSITQVTYFKYNHPTDPRIIEVRYETISDKRWFCGSVSGTTKSSLLSFLSTGSLIKHKRTPAEKAVDRSKMKFTCSGCKEVITGQGTFNTHKSTCSLYAPKKRDLSSERYTCSKCESVFIGQGNFNTHRSACRWTEQP